MNCIETLRNIKTTLLGSRIYAGAKRPYRAAISPLLLEDREVLSPERWEPIITKEVNSVKKTDKPIISVNFNVDITVNGNNNTVTPTGSNFPPPVTAITILVICVTVLIVCLRCPGSFVDFINVVRLLVNILTNN